jgi:DNA topoisomerase-1
MRLRTVSPNQPGWTRRRAGRGFVYVDADGLRLGDIDFQRCRELVIPPAWREVWICPYTNGHILATGTDDAGRRQYLYHPEWRRKQDEANTTGC